MRVGAVWSTDRSVYWVRHTKRGRVIESDDAPWEFFVDAPVSEHPTVIREMSRSGAWARTDGSYVRVGVRPAGLQGTRRRQVRDALRDRARDLYGSTRVMEADIDPARRWLADRTDVEISQELSIAYLDIEAKSPGMSIDDARAGRSTILSYAALGSDGRSDARILLGDDSRDAQSVDADELWREEQALVHALLRFLSRYDVVVAWYGGDVREGTGFDFDVIRNRCEYLRLRPGSAFSADPDTPRRDIRWETWVWLDQLEVARKYGEMDGSMALGAVAKRLGIEQGKIELDMNQLWEFWASGPEARARILEYNIRDTALLPQIEERTGYLQLHLGVARLCNQVPHTRALKATSQADGFMLRFSGGLDYRWPTCWWDEDPPDEDIEGAYVFQPVLGLHEWVSIADFSSLYPSIIRSWNIGPDTVIHDETNIPPGVPVAKAPSIDAWFRTDVDSHFRRALAALVANRNRYKSALDDLTPGTRDYAQMEALSQAAKIVANSFYGVLLCKWSRFYSGLAGLAVTSTGQWLIQTVARILEKIPGYRIIGGDTDSVFVQTPRDPITPIGSDEILSDHGRALVAAIDGINASWQEHLDALGCNENHIELDWEQTFARLVVFGKKLYVGTSHYMKGSRPKRPWKHKYRGLGIRRGDRIAVAKEAQLRVVEAVIGREDETDLPPIPSAAELYTMIEVWRERILDGELTLTDVVLRQGLRKSIDQYRSESAFTSERCAECRYIFPTAMDWQGPTTCPSCGTARRRREPPAHVRVAEQLRERGETPLPGDKIEYVYLFDPDVKRDSWYPKLASEADIELLDRAQCWYSVYSGMRTIAAAVHPDESWPDPGKWRTKLRAERRRELATERARTRTEGVAAILADPALLFQ